MYTRLTKEGRALRNGGFKFLGRAVLVVVVGGTVVVAAQAAAPAVTSWWHDVRLWPAAPPAMAVTQQPQTKTNPPPQQVRQEPQPAATPIRSQDHAVLEWNERGIEWHAPQFKQTNRTGWSASARNDRGPSQRDRDAETKQREKEWRDKREAENQRQAQSKKPDQTSSKDKQRKNESAPVKQSKPSQKSEKPGSTTAAPKRKK
jgi:hypothetical protein